MTGDTFAPQSPTPDLQLLHFRFSPYNEKVRWALDLKKLPHHRRSLLPGPHMPVVKKLTGQTATPVLSVDDRWMTGSARILAALDEMSPAPRLLPRDPKARSRAEQIQNKCDTDWGPRVRRVVLCALMSDANAIVSVFCGHKRALVRLPYRSVFPLAKSMIARGNGITGPESVEDGKAAIAEAMEFVAANAGDGGYLAGDAFSVADIAAASILATVLEMAGTPMHRPIALPPLLGEMNLQWGDHPGAVWVRQMFTRHRPEGMAPDGLISYPATD